MWRAIAAGLALSFLGAGCASPTYTTRHGLRVYDHTRRRVPQERVEAVTERALHFFGVDGVLDGVAVHFYSKLIQLPGPDDTLIIADGYTDPLTRTVIASSFSQCVSASSLVHELGHLIRMAADGSPDRGHRDVAYWEAIAAFDHVLQKEMCSDAQMIREQMARRSPAAPTQPAAGDAVTRTTKRRR